MVDLNGHEAGNGGHSQGKPKAYRDSSTRREAILQQQSTQTPLGLEKCWSQLESLHQPLIFSISDCAEPKTDSPNRVRRRRTNPRFGRPMP